MSFSRGCLPLLPPRLSVHVCPSVGAVPISGGLWNHAGHRALRWLSSLTETRSPPSSVPPPPPHLPPQKRSPFTRKDAYSLEPECPPPAGAARAGGAGQADCTWAHGRAHWPSPPLWCSGHVLVPPSHPLEAELLVPEEPVGGRGARTTGRRGGGFLEEVLSK